MLIRTFVVILALSWPLAAHAAIYRVDASSTVTTPDGSTGSTWALAYPLLQDAVDRAQPGDTIRVAGGTYRPDLDTTGLFLPEHISNSRTESFILEDEVRLEGGYSGLANPTNPDERGLYVSILTGDIGTASDISDNSFHVVTGGDSNQFTFLNAFTIKLGNGDATSGADAKKGAGIYLLATNEPRIENCIIEYCVAEDRGGGIFLEADAVPVFTGCTVRHNSAVEGGGAAIESGSSAPVTFATCTFTYNEAEIGGALWTRHPTEIRQSDLSLNSVRSNSGIARGGALWSDNTILLRECNLGHNVAESISVNGAEGGSLHFDGESATLIRCNFIENQVLMTTGSPNSFAGAAYLRSTVDVINCIFSGNKIVDGNDADAGAGGAMLASKNVRLTNTLIYDSRALEAGAIYLFDHKISLVNCTVARNSASAANSTGGLFDSANTSTSDNFIYNSIFWGNTGGAATTELQQINLQGLSGTFVIQHNIIEGRIASGQYDSNDDQPNLDADPQFVDPSENNWRLKRCSPAIDAADSTKLVEDASDVDDDTETTCNGCDIDDAGEFTPDLDRRLRITDLVPTTDTGVIPSIDCPLTCEKVVDMGAYEYACAVCTTLGDLNGDGNVNGLDIQPFSRCVVDSTSSVYCPCGDLNGDYAVNVADVPCFIELLLVGQTSCPGSCDYCEGSPFSLKDCNGNSVPDANDIADGTSEDCNGNRVPDECDIDTEDPDGNELVSNDVNSNDIPDECEQDCNRNTVPDAWDISEETSNDVNSNAIPDECEPDCNSNEVPDAWDISTEESPDCNENGNPDECDVDCNNNFIPDDCDIAADPSLDCNTNGELDECDLARSMLPSFDCNDNKIPDECDIASESSADENENGIPDECEEESRDAGEGGGEIDAEAAWNTFFEWYDEQVFGDPGDWHTLTGPERFHRVMDELSLLGLPYAAPW